MIVFKTHVCGSAHEALPDIVYSVAVETEAVRLVRSVYQVLDVLSYVFVQLLEHSLRLLSKFENSQLSSIVSVNASTGRWSPTSSVNGRMGNSSLCHGLVSSVRSAFSACWQIATASCNLRVRHDKP